MNLNELIKLADEVQPIKGQKNVYMNMYKHIFPMLTDVSGDFLEVGCFKGKTTIFISNYLTDNYPTKTIYTIDPHSDEISKGVSCWEQGVFEHFTKHTEGLTNHQHYPMLSEDGAACIADDSIAFSFIDGDHSYEGVRKDIKLFLPKVVIGGIFCFDDYVNGKWPGVGQALKEINKQRLKLIYKGEKEVYYRKLK
ncbi:MAG: class I SAM-dependent methyltransferase [Petrotogales bacterium]